MVDRLEEACAQDAETRLRLVLLPDGLDDLEREEREDFQWLGFKHDSGR